MSASIYWEPANRPAKDVPVSAPSRFLTTLQKLTGTSGQEFILGEDHIAALEALGDCSPYQDDRHNPYLVLVEAIEKHGSIRVWAVY